MYDEEKKEFMTKTVDGEPYNYEMIVGLWTNDLDIITVKEIGLATEGISKGVLMTSRR